MLSHCTGPEAHSFYCDKKSVLSPKSSIPFAAAGRAPAGTTSCKAISPVTGRKWEEAGLSLSKVLKERTYLISFYS